jgi:hypothetical protein
MAGMPDGGMAASRAVRVRVVAMLRRSAGVHGFSSFPCPGAADTAARPSAA